jgi:carboxyl-terminal processing protease
MRHVGDPTRGDGVAEREGLWLLARSLDPTGTELDPFATARALSRAGGGPEEAAGAIDDLRVAWNRWAPGRTLGYAEIAERALDLVLRRLDPHSSFFAKAAWTEMVRSISGEYSGIGIVVRDQGGPVVDDVFEGGPADGVLRRRDRIVAVDGRDLTGMKSDEYLSLIRGEPGTQVQLRVRRNHQDLTLTLTRRHVKAPAVRRTLAGPRRDVLVLGLRAYTDGCADEMEEALRRCASPPRAVILDLRNNPGGTVDDAVAIVDLFIDRGVVITERGRETKVLEADSSGTALPPSVPMLVLVNRFSASAAELTAGALRDHGRAALMGETTYGKGTVQEIYRFGDRGAKVTVARFYLPAGRSTQIWGVSPDLPFPDSSPLDVEDGEPLYERDYDNAVAPHALSPAIAGAADLAPLLARLRGRLGRGGTADAGVDEEDAMLQEAIRIVAEETVSE